jgi:kynurenine formamidase
MTRRASRDADTIVTVDDIKAWEERYGRLPPGAAVFMDAGWDAKVHDAKAFINTDDLNTMHFPGFAAETAGFLVRERDVVGIGVDTLSLDPGRDKAYSAHKVWLAADKWGVECVANLRHVPPSGGGGLCGRCQSWWGDRRTGKAYRMPLVRRGETMTWPGLREWARHLKPRSSLC